MFTKYKDVGLKKDVKSLVKNVSCLRRIQIFLRKGAPNFDILSCIVFSDSTREGVPNFDIFSCVVFSDSNILKHLENEQGSRGSGSMHLR